MTAHAAFRAVEQVRHFAAYRRHPDVRTCLRVMADVTAAAPSSMRLGD
jgi:hypothetical protein